MNKKFLISLLFLSFTSFSNEVIRTYNNYEDPNFNFSTQKLKQLKRPFDNYIFIKINSNIRENADVDSKKIETAVKNSRIKVLELVLNKKDEFWYKVETKEGKIGYVFSDLAIKRKYKFEDAVEKSKKFNNFIAKYKDNLRVLDKFIPLDTERGLPADYFGNSSNQSVTVYTDENKTNYYNLQDRTVFSIIGQTKNSYIIVSPLYKEKLYLPKKERRYIKKINLKKVNKFVYINKKDQNEISFEISKNDKYNLLTVSDVTTGKNSKFGFETPKGFFLVDSSKPVMTYIRDVDKKKNEDLGEIKDEGPQVVGEAKYAIRFSGGAYMHGIPSLYEPKETLKERKEITKSLLGTYNTSHKCVRNYDEVVETLYHWVGSSSKKSSYLRKPKVPVVVIVED